MSQLTLESTVVENVNALKVDLATKLAGEDAANAWMKNNPQGFLTAKGRVLTPSGQAVANHDFEMTTQHISIYNAASVRLWVCFGTEAGKTQANDEIAVEPGMTLSLPLRTVSGEAQVSMILNDSSTTTAGIPVLVLGN